MATNKTKQTVTEADRLKFVVENAPKILAGLMSVVGQNGWTPSHPHLSQLEDQALESTHRLFDKIKRQLETGAFSENNE